MRSDLPRRRPSNAPRRAPLLVRWALGRLLAPLDRRAALDELDELFEIRRERDGEPAARAWRRRQLAQYPWRLLIERLRSGSVPSEGIGRPVRRPPRRGEPMRNVTSDLKLSLRNLVRSPGVGSTDPATFAGVAAAMLAVAVLACLAPARRAAAVDPVTALRAD